LNGTRHFPLGLGGPAEPINIIAIMTMKRPTNSPHTWGVLIVASRDLARRAAARVKFTPILVRLTAKRPY